VTALVPQGRVNLAQDASPTSVNLFGVFFSNLPQNRHPERRPHRFYRVIHRLGAKSKDLEGRLSYSCRWHPFNHRSPHLADPPRFEEFAQTWGWKMIQCMKRCTHDHQVRIAGGIQFSGLGSRKAPNSIDKISNFGVLRLRAQAVYHAIKSVRRFAQDDDFVGGSRKTPQIG
jgi:hypothetical protein